MKKVTKLTGNLSLIKKMALAIGLGLLPYQAIAEDFCATLPSCEDLGYVYDETICAGKAVIKCPFDKTKFFCNISNVKKCEIGDIVYTSNMCFSKDPVGEPKGIVIHPIRRIALALEYASDTPVPLMTTAELTEANSKGAFDWTKSTLYNTDAPLGANYTPFVSPASYNANTGYITGPTKDATQNILGNKPGYTPFPITLNAEKLCTGEWFLPPVGAFYDKQLVGPELTRYRSNTKKFMNSETVYNLHNGKPVYLWTSSFYGGINKAFPTMIVVVFSGTRFLHLAIKYPEALSQNSIVGVKQLLEEITSYGNNAPQHFMVRCATRY